MSWTACKNTFFTPCLAPVSRVQNFDNTLNRNKRSNAPTIKRTKSIAAPVVIPRRPTTVSTTEQEELIDVIVQEEAKNNYSGMEEINKDDKNYYLNINEEKPESKNIPTDPNMPIYLPSSPSNSPQTSLEPVNLSSIHSLSRQSSLKLSKPNHKSSKSVTFADQVQDNGLGIGLNSEIHGVPINGHHRNENKSFQFLPATQQQETDVMKDNNRKDLQEISLSPQLESKNEVDAPASNYLDIPGSNNLDTPKRVKVGHHRATKSAEFDDFSILKIHSNKKDSKFSDVDTNKIEIQQKSSSINSSDYWKKIKTLLIHPWLRLLIFFPLFLLQFFMISDNPIYRSHIEHKFEVVGHSLTFLFFNYPSESNGAQAIRLGFIVICIIIGGIIGKKIIHKRLLMRLLHIDMFKENKGSFAIVITTILIFFRLFSLLYNVSVRGLYNYDESWDITGAFQMSEEHYGVTNREYYEVHTIIVWICDTLMLLFILDMILQKPRQENEDLYPEFTGFGLTKLWNGSVDVGCCQPKDRSESSALGGRRCYCRTLSFWIITGALLILIFSIGVGGAFLPGNLSYTLGSNEVGRCWIQAWIVFLDFCIIMQDWDFPYFEDKLFYTKLPGLNIHDIILPFFKKHIVLSQKWIIYGLMFLIIILDLHTLGLLISYLPIDFGQYTDPDGYIYSITSPQLISIWRENPNLISYDSRVINPNPLFENITTSDQHADLLYNGWEGAQRTGVIPVVVIILIFLGIVISKISFSRGITKTRVSITNNENLDSDSQKESYKRNRKSSVKKTKNDTIDSRLQSAQFFSTEFKNIELQNIK